MVDQFGSPFFFDYYFKIILQLQIFRFELNR